MRSTVYRNEDCSIDCLRPSRIATDVASRIFQLIAEMLADHDDDNDNPLLTSGDNEDELEVNELTVEDTDFLHKL